MPEGRLPMRKTREILRLHFESHLIPEQIASICTVSRSTVQRCLERLKSAGMKAGRCQPILDDVALERRLYPPPPVASPERLVACPIRPVIHKELEEPEECHPSVVVGGVQAGQPAGLQSHSLVLASFAYFASGSGATGRRCCDRNTEPGKSCCSSIMPDRRLR